MFDLCGEPGNDTLNPVEDTKGSGIYYVCRGDAYLILHLKRKEKR
jgi:hypothetical protein